MRLTDETYEFIKQEVIDMLVRFDVKCTPISGFEIAQKMGIMVIPYSALSQKKKRMAIQLSADGFYLEPGNGTEIIYYNDWRDYGRSNMTLLHEIGHCLLGHDDRTDSCVAEAEASFFAKYAIAPPPLVSKFAPACPEDIQREFCISHEAACNAFDYYRKWLLYGSPDYTNYEVVLLRQFAVVA